MDSLNQVLSMIYKKSPLQKKKLESYISTRPETFFKEADKFITDYSSYLESQKIPFSYAVESYLKMCKDMFKSQIYFIKTDKYPLENQNQAFEEVYDSDEEMHSFMIALALSQYLWGTHYEMFKHFQLNINQNQDKIKNYLEIGPGHGLFFKYAIQNIGPDCGYNAVDISKTSLEMTKNIISFFKLYGDNINYINNDMLKISSIGKKFDFITMGEVLEHVNFPEKLLLKLKSLLHVRGKAFISTCVNCPTIDHVYHYRSVEEIQEMLFETGFEIVSEKVLPVEDLPMKEVVEEKITINYCAIIEHQN
jgi:ubiquinone/menaquinone biosynthesis C-methylase UbiE